MLKKNKNGKCPFGYVEFNGMCVRENQMNQFQFSNEFTSSNGYQPPPPPKPPPPTPTPPGPSPAPDDTEAFLRRAAEVTGAIFGVGVGALEADQRYEEYKVLERMRINRAAREVDEFYSMFSAPEPGEGITPTDIEMGYGDFANDEFPNLFRGTEEPMTDSMGRLLSDDRFLINTDTEQGLAEMTDADIQAEIQRMVEEAETGTTMRPQDGQETDPIQARRNKDAEQAAQEEYEKRQKAREAEGDPFEGAPEFDDIDLDLDNMGGDYDGDERITPIDDEVDINAQVEKYYDSLTDEEKKRIMKDSDNEVAKGAEEFYEYNPGENPKQDVSDLVDEMAEEMGTPLPDDVPTSPNIMTEEEWNSLEPGLKGGSEFGGVAAEEAVEEAERIIAGAEAAGTIITEAERVSMITRVALAAEAGDDVAVGSAIMTGLLTEGVASIGAVAAVGVEFAALGALTYGAEKVYKAAEGIVERPDSLDGAAHEITEQEMAYFQSVAKQQVRDAQGVYADDAVGAPRRRQPNSPFAPKGSGSGERPTRQSDARNKALYNDMSDAEKKVFDDNYNKMIADEQASIDYWNNIPEGTMIQNSADGYQLIPPHTVSDNTLQPKPGTPQSWIDDFNQQLENDKIRKQQDGIGNQETMAQEEMAAAQLQKDVEMKEVYDYLEYMTARDQAYLDSLEPTAEAQPESQPEAESQDMPDNA